MNLDDLIGFGFYVNAGFVDYYDGKRHHRVGEVSSIDGLVTFTDAGRKIANELMTKEALRVLTAEADNQAAADAAKAAEEDRLEAVAAAATAEADRLAVEAERVDAERVEALHAKATAAMEAEKKAAERKAKADAKAFEAAEKQALAKTTETQNIAPADVGSLEDLLGDLKA